MRDLMGVGAICLIGLWFIVITLPTPEDGLKARKEACRGRGYAVIIDGKFSGCTGDAKSSGNMYYPDHGPVEMRKIPELNDDWIVGE